MTNEGRSEEFSDCVEVLGVRGFSETIHNRFVLPLNQRTLVPWQDLPFLEVKLEVLEGILKASTPPGPHEERVQQGTHQRYGEAVLQHISKACQVALGLEDPLGCVRWALND